jgi:hypothetical protein
VPISGLTDMNLAPYYSARADYHVEEEPLYVNAKQYNRILKRRQARAKFETKLKIAKEKVF